MRVHLGGLQMMMIMTLGFRSISRATRSLFMRLSFREQLKVGFVAGSQSSGLSILKIPILKTGRTSKMAKNFKVATMRTQLFQSNLQSRSLAELSASVPLTSMMLLG